VLNSELSEISDHMFELGTSALAHANWHANYMSFENHMWPELSVLQAAHAAEILIKARIAEEHPLLIFDQVPKSTQVDDSKLGLKHLFEKAKTIQYSELPERLWAATGIKLKNIDAYKKFGYLRNSIQHFASPSDVGCSEETRKFIYQVIDPFIHDCWGITAVDYNEDHEPYIYLMANLITNGVEFLVSNAAANNLQYTELNWPNENYKQLMLKRFKQAGADVSDL
jgi:hypothetical protein